mgnify:CR=1 FL=1
MVATSTTAQTQQEPPKYAGFCPTYTFEGALNDGAGNSYPIHLELLCLLDSTLVGHYYYKPENGQLKLGGQLLGDSTFTLGEWNEKSELTGMFRGHVHRSFTSLTGSWENPDRSRTLSFDLHRSMTSYSDYLAKWRSYPDYVDLHSALSTKSTVYQLHLRSMGFTTLPDSLARLDRLLSLSLLDNKFDTLPSVVTRLLTLEDLSLAGNEGIYLGTDIARLGNLRMLILTFNELTSLEPAIGELNNLLYLDASHNALTSVPPEFENLKQLQILDLSFNPISKAAQNRIRNMLPNCLVKF